MRKIFCASLVCLVSSFVYGATSDRFGNLRLEVPRSSYTETTDRDVLIATVTPQNTGAIYLRSVTFSGVTPSTISFYDTVTFQSDTSTRAKIVYPGVVGTSAVSPGTYWINQYYSSGTMYNKQGTAPCIINWDYSTPPRYGGVGK